MKRKHRQPVVSASLGAKEMPSGPPTEPRAQGGGNLMPSVPNGRPTLPY